MELSSSTQSIIAGALIDFVGRLTTLPRSIQVGASEPVYDIHEEFVRWAHHRQLDLKEAEIEQWWSTKKASQMTLEDLTQSQHGNSRRIVGALRDFVEFAKNAGGSDFENLLLRWATRREFGVT